MPLSPVEIPSDFSNPPRLIASLGAAVVLAVLSVLPVAAAFAADDATVDGLVVDASGSVVPGAAI